MKTLITILILLISSNAIADEFYIHLPMISRHGETPDDKTIRGGQEEWNEENYGIGLYYGDNKSFNYGGTILKDSYNHMSAYMGGECVGNIVDYNGFNVSIGIFGGVSFRKVEGVFPVILPSLHVGYEAVTLNISYVPRVEVDSADFAIPSLLFFSLTIELNGG